MYQIIYDYLNQYVIGTLTIQDAYAPQLCMILTHTSIILIYITLVFLLVWVFKTVVSAFKF